ncbi:hypothetical protein [Acinetobacter nectaris]|uniref:hypothetical protein n=1 Tax=Acinetobacter nectaris TaxID=1219382 RepID=UPI001F3E3830|nr:hypothetical protein [Acinetobacter nectaris]MCF9035389.1 hypothetical protein [Acinetobacter nectaris]
MKINIEFNWAFFTSVFTIFLYWCGYFYLAGLASYFHYNIDAFDIPLPTIILYGITRGYQECIYFISFIIAYSFFQNLLKNRLNYIFNKMVALSINFLIIIFRFKPVSFTICWSFSPFLILIKYLCKKETVELIKSKTPNLVLVIYKWILYENRRLKVLTYLGLKEARLSPLEIKKIKNKCENSANFDLVFLAHYFSLTLLIIGLLVLFTFGQGLFKKGKQDSQIQFENSLLNHHYKKEISHNTYPQIELLNSKKDVLFSTEICFKGSCLITDLNRNVQLQEVKNIKFLGSSKYLL